MTSSSLRVVLHAAAPCHVQVSIRCAVVGSHPHEYLMGARRIRGTTIAPRSGLRPSRFGGASRLPGAVVDDDGQELSHRDPGSFTSKVDPYFQYFQDPRKDPSVYTNAGGAPWWTWRVDGDGYIVRPTLGVQWSSPAGQHLPQEAENLLIMPSPAGRPVGFGVPNEEFVEDVKPRTTGRGVTPGPASMSTHRVLPSHHLARLTRPAHSRIRRTRFAPGPERKPV